MHFYDKSFIHILRKNYEKVVLISNFKTSDNAVVELFEDFYAGNFIIKFFKLFKSLCKFYYFILKNRRNYFIFLSYGNAYEFIFSWSLIFCHKVIVDIHEVISLIVKKPFQSNLRNLYSKVLFNNFFEAVIVHSERSELLLDQLGYNKLRLHIPHFSYFINTNISEDLISDEVKSLIAREKINVLFFGFMRNSKGIDKVIDIAEKMTESRYGDKISFIIAGNDPDNIVKPLINNHQNKDIRTVKPLLRYINDDELIYLFSNTNYVFLPYKQISQSGIMEMAIHFRKPVITSSISYFKDFLSRFPSFGISGNSVSGEDYFDIFKTLIEEDLKNKPCFYLDADIKNYNHYKDPKEFLDELKVFFPVI